MFADELWNYVYGASCERFGNFYCQNMFDKTKRLQGPNIGRNLWCDAVCNGIFRDCGTNE